MQKYVFNFSVYSFLFSFTFPRLFCFWKILLTLLLPTSWPTLAQEFIAYPYMDIQISTVGYPWFFIPFFNSPCKCWYSCKDILQWMSVQHEYPRMDIRAFISNVYAFINIHLDIPWFLKIDIHKGYPNRDIQTWISKQGYPCKDILQYIRGAWISTNRYYCFISNIRMLLLISTWISNDFFGYPSMDLLWILDPGKGKPHQRWYLLKDKGHSPEFKYFLPMFNLYHRFNYTSI